MIHDRCWPTIKVTNQGSSRVDPEMMIDRGQKISGTTSPLNDILAPFVRGTDITTGLDSAAGPEIGKRAGPVIATGIFVDFRSLD